MCALTRASEGEEGGRERRRERRDLRRPENLVRVDDIGSRVDVAGVLWEGGEGRGGGGRRAGEGEGESDRIGR